MRDAGRYEAIVRDLIEQERSMCEAFSSSLNRLVNQFDENQRRMENAIVNVSALRTIEKAASSLVEARMSMDHLVESMSSFVNRVETSMRWLVDDSNQRRVSLIAEDRLALVRIASEGILDLFRGPMADESRLFHEESLVETTVTYTLEMEGRLIVVENVPAGVDTETGEQFFSPQTVERLQEIVRGGMKPVRVIETLVFDYDA